MNELTFEDFSKLKKEEQLNKLKEEYKNNKTNEGELKICNLLAVHQLSKKQLKLILKHIYNSICFHYSSSPF